MNQTKVGEIVDVDFVLQDDHDAVVAQSDSPDFAAEEKLSDALALVIVPDDDFVRGIPGRDERHEVTSEEHLDDGEAIAIT